MSIDAVMRQASELTVDRESDTGILIINADDWGRDRDTTDRIADCIRCGTVSSTSAMVFMQDSERSAEIAKARSIDTGLHLNLTQPFTLGDVPNQIAERHNRICRYLLRSRASQVVFHPGLANSFQYVVAAQLEEYQRLYGEAPNRIDGHHHMHQCANVILQNLLPVGTIVRRNFSFKQGEKSFVNRSYRKLVDRRLASRHRLVDLFFSLAPVDSTDRLRRIFSFARNAVVEVAAHPGLEIEHRFLTEGAILDLTGECPIAARFALRSEA
jgi:predicted glycoside hydrolase/deacetylase ChbG (UPF0249 family)